MKLKKSIKNDLGRFIGQEGEAATKIRSLLQGKVKIGRKSYIARSLAGDIEKGDRVKVQGVMTGGKTLIVTKIEG